VSAAVLAARVRMLTIIVGWVGHRSGGGRGESPARPGSAAAPQVAILARFDRVGELGHRLSQHPGNSTPNVDPQ